MFGKHIDVGFVRYAIQSIVCKAGMHVIGPIGVCGYRLESGIFINPFIRVRGNYIVNHKDQVRSRAFVYRGMALNRGYFVNRGIAFTGRLFHSKTPSPSPSG